MTASPRPFTAADFAGRMERAATQAQAAGLTGVLVTPGPDLVYMAGYAPVAITERLTLLVVQPGREPAMILPILERPDAEIFLMGVEEPKCLIHAPNESVDPSEIEHLALAEALFLLNYAAR